MILYLIKPNEYFTLILPERVKGQYWLKDFDKSGNERKLISVEAVGKEWVLKSNNKAKILDDHNSIVKNISIKSLCFLNVKVTGSSERVILFSEPITKERSTYSKFIVREQCSFKIGREEGNDIVFHNEFVSSNHAQLDFDGNRWNIIDRNSTNGTYVNGIRVISKNLSPGDCIFIMGLKIVIGKQFFSINNPDGNVQLRTSKIQKYVSQKVDVNKEFDEELGKQFFFRSPRLKRDIVEKEITIDPPPQPQKVDQTPIGLVIGPSITMGMASMSMGIFSVVNVLGNGGSLSQALPMLIMAFSMLLGTVLWPILTRKYEKKQRVKLEAKRQQKYLDYLEEIKDQIRNETIQQTEILQTNVITLEECAERILQERDNLWERSTGQNDYLSLRVGTGNLPLKMKVNYQEKKFSLDNDNLQNAMFAIGTEKKELINVPVSFSLMENYNTGIIGDYHQRMNFLKSILLQIVSLHSYDECKICLICDENMLNELAFVKFIQHFWSDDKRQRYLAVTPEEVRELSAELEKNLLPRANSRDADMEIKPYFVVIAASMKLADMCESYRKLLSLEKNYSISLISFGGELKDLPKEVKTVIDITNEEGGKIFNKEDISGNYLTFKPEMIKDESLFSVGEKLSNIYLDLESQKFELPNMMTFLEMFQVGKIEHLNSLSRWKDNNPTKTLQTPIGVGTNGEPFLLDLHEKYHGPHGLVAGMTGSGKSEFIITYILSLAVNYHPDEVAFVLIDYKGGGLAGAFEDPDKGIKLPHLAGTITNLDGSAITRSLISIQSELRRRQAIFNEARKVSNEGTMDIYKYQQLYRSGIVKTPIPHLFIISDEFAELKTQQPEFMEQLISAARIGRSLGVHLILATQKPSGVVDDQIWSNSKFRVCLKVQEKADSQEMIKRPDAAELSQTGRFYLQVGFNEFFALGQSAWCGAEYIPAETIEKSVDNSIQVIDNLGRTMIEVKPTVKIDTSQNRIKQIVGIVQYLSDLANEENVYERPLWLPVIASHIYLEDMEKKYDYMPQVEDLCPVVGEYDDPYNQSQHALTIPLTRDGNCLIYGSVGSGKELFLTTLIFSLVKNYSPKDVNLYIMDFGAETLRAFEQAPHVGGVALVSETEKIVNLLKMIRTELSMRKKLFAAEGGDYASYCKKTGERMPQILVVINNYSPFREQYEDYEAVFQNLSSDGLKYGIYFVVTASATNALRYTIVQNFKTVLTLQLNDETEYSSIVGRTNGLYPSPYIGRGLMRQEDLYEFQVAYCKDCVDQLEYIRDFCMNLRSKEGYFAKEIPVLPKVVNTEYVSKYNYSMESVPLGISKKELELMTFNLKNTFIYPIAAQDLDNCVDFMKEILRVLEKLSMELIVWKDYKDIEKQVNACFEEMVKRNNLYKDAGMDASVLDSFEEKVWVLFGLRDIMEHLSEDGKDKLHALLENGKSIYKTHFIMLDTASNFREYNLQNWYKSNLNQSDGVWIGDGVTDQYFLSISKMRNEYYDELGNYYGYYFAHGKPILMKVLSEKEEE